MKEIKKSLIDKKIESFSYNPKLVTNENSKTIKQIINKNLKESESFDIAVSYIVWSGLSLIYPEMKRFNSNSRLLVTTEGFVTDPQSLERLLKLGISVRVYNPYSNAKGFHLKSFIFNKEEESTLLIGSSNISARAFGLAHEMAVEINSKKEGYILEKYNNVFEELWNDDYTVPLTKEFIDKYKEVYNYNAEINRNIFEYNLEEDQIKPNYMQEKALEALEEARKENNKGLVIAATGTGKTYLSAFDVKNSKAKKVLFLVHNRLILSSAIETYQRIFPDKKLLELTAYNKKQLHESDFIFTTDKTAHNLLLEKIDSKYFDYIIYDEAHRIGEETQYDAIMNYFEPKFTLGITATPERTKDPKFLFEKFEYSVPYEIRLLDSLDHELVCPFTYYGFNTPESVLKDNQKFDYYELAKYFKDKIEEKGHYGDKLRALVFCSNITEANEVSTNLKKVGLNAISLNSKSANNELMEEYILDLKSSEKGSLEIICAVDKFNEGIDIPDINTIIMLRDTKSSIIYLQQLGRGLRRTNDPHKYVTVFDIIGNSKNSYTIAEVLTGNQTADKRLLYHHANTNFEMVSPYINVLIEEEAIKNIINSISNNFTVKTKIRRKFQEELTRYEIIPDLDELYDNPKFKELELLQLVYKNLYEPFDKYYKEKYNIEENNKFLTSFFKLITQFVFRAYDKKTLEEYIKVLNGSGVNSETLRKVLMPKDFRDGIATAINSDYYKVANNYPKVFEYINGLVFIREEIIELLKNLNAYELYKEHIKLFEKISEKPDYKLQTFDLLDKGEFLFNVGAKDCYMNAVGERIDHKKKAVYCTIKITEKESFYDNYIIDNDKVVYYTQRTNSEKAALNKIETIKKYKFNLAAQFPHLGYSQSSYFYLGNVEIYEISEVLEDKDGKYNHKIIFKLEKKLPNELIQYKS